MGCAGKGQLPDGMPQEERAVHEVCLALGGEMAGSVDFAQSPLSKAGADDLYVINVYAKETLGAGNVLYAYGTFSEAGDLRLALEDGYLYDFHVTLVRDAHDALLWKNDSVYAWQLENDEGTLLNRFIKATSFDDGGFDANTARLYCKEDGMYHYRPRVNRWYGETLDFDPAQSGTVDVNLYRMVYGVRLNITGLTEGTLTFAMKDAQDIVVNADSLYTPDNLYQCNYLENAAAAAATGENYAESAWTTIQWTNAVGDETVTLHDYTIFYTRLQRSIFNIRLEQGTPTKSGMNIEVEQEFLPMADVRQDGGSDVE